MNSNKITPQTARDFSDLPRGVQILENLELNKGSAFTKRERDALGLHGLLPPHVSTQDEQVERVMRNFKIKATDLERYIFMISLQQRNQHLFYRVVLDNIEEMLPILYTPTVGKACQEFGNIYRGAQGLYISANDKGRISDVLDNWRYPNAKVIVVTDGERILGLGDLGANGMGIPIGKLILYSACAGIPPSDTLPIMLDVGTNNESLINDELYLGLKQPRMRGEEYDLFIDEFIQAISQRYTEAVIQFEDFGKSNAFRLLNKYRDQVCTFNDDIQGTAAVVLAGIQAAQILKKSSITSEKFLFLGAGGAGVGIANLIVSALVQDGMPEAEARERCWLMDSKGLIVRSRINDLDEFKRPYAHEHPPIGDLHTAIEQIRPTSLIGVSVQHGSFTPEILQKMAEINQCPLIMALSNPTSMSECTAKEAYKHTGGRAIFASGSPFAPVTIHGKTFVPGQGNNAYIFPGVGLGILVSGARHVSDEMVLAAATALGDQVTQDDLNLGRIYPPLTNIRKISVAIAAAVTEVAHEQGIATLAMPDNLKQHIQDNMFSPDYPIYVK